MSNTFKKSFEPILSYFQEVLPVYQDFHVSLNCLKFLHNEEFAVGSTNTGFIIFLNILTKSFKQEKISQNAINDIHIFSNDSLLLAVEDYTIHILETSTLFLSRSIKFKPKYGKFDRALTSFDENSVFCKFNSGRLITVEISDTYFIKTLIKNVPLIDFAINSDGLYLGYYKHISLFSPSLEKISERKIEINSPYKILISNTNRYFSLYNKYLFKICYRNKLERINKVPQVNEILSVTFTSDDKFIVLYLNNSSLLFLSCPNSEQLIRIPIESETCKSIQISSDSSKIFMFSGQKLVTIKFPKPSKLISCKSFTEVDLSFNSFLRPSKEVIFSIGNSTNIKFTLKSSKKTFFLSGHEDIVTCVIALNENICASGSMDFDVRVWDYKERTCVGMLRGHIAAVSCLDDYQEWLISGSLDQTVKIWDWKGCTLFHTINMENKIMGLVNWKDVMIVGLPDKLSLWDLNNFSLIGFNAVSQVIDCVQLEYEGKQILINKAKKVFVKNPLWDNSINVWGNGGGYTFMGHVYEILNGNTPKYNKHLNSFVILPYRYNIIHFYCFFGLTEHLTQALLDGCGVFNSINNINPAILAVDQKNLETCSAFFEWANKYRFHPVMFRNITIDELVKINKSGVAELRDLYEMLWMESITIFPKYASDLEDFPKIFKSIDPTLSSLNFFNQISGNDSGFEISYFTTLNKFPLTCGTNDSIMFLESLPLDNEKLFKSDYIQQVVLYKWSQ